jgi:hypothetical protein
MPGFRRSICQYNPQDRQDVRDAEGFLETTGLAGACSSRITFNQIAGHVDDGRSLGSRSLEDAACDDAAVHCEAAGGEMQVAEKHVVGGAPEMSESLLGGRGTIHAQALGRETFLKKHPKTLFIVENEYRAAPENIGHRSNCSRRGHPGFRRSGKCLGKLAGRDR